MDRGAIVVGGTYPLSPRISSGKNDPLFLSLAGALGGIWSCIQCYPCKGGKGERGQELRGASHRTVEQLAIAADYPYITHH